MLMGWSGIWVAKAGSIDPRAQARTIVKRRNRVVSERVAIAMT
jgi:hypothetical protein